MTFRTLVGAAVIVAIAALARPLDAQSQDTPELPTLATGQPALAAPTATFEWSMPARTAWMLTATGSSTL